MICCLVDSSGSKWATTLQSSQCQHADQECDLQSVRPAKKSNLSFHVVLLKSLLEQYPVSLSKQQEIILSDAGRWPDSQSWRAEYLQRRDLKAHRECWRLQRCPQCTRWWREATSEETHAEHCIRQESMALVDHGNWLFEFGPVDMKLTSRVYCHWLRTDNVAPTTVPCVKRWTQIQQKLAKVNDTFLE